MAGEPELWSKALAFVIAEQAAKENRSIEINLFDTQVNGSMVLNKETKNRKELLDFVGTWSLGGGTSFNAVLSHAVHSSSVTENSDVLLITDGHSEVNQARIKELNALKANKKIQWNTLCINTTVPPVCSTFSDEVYSVDLAETSKTIDVIQKCL